jgi:hypothetical protein
VNFVEASKTIAVLDENLTSSQTHSPVIDTIGFGHASIDVVFEKVAAAGTNSAVATVLKLQQGDGTTWSDITGFVGGTSFTIPTPTGTTSDNVVRFDVDLKGQQGRYLRPFATGQATGSIYTVARLSKAEQAPADATSKGALRTVSGQLGVSLAPNTTYVS